VGERPREFAAARGDRERLDIRRAGEPALVAVLDGAVGDSDRQVRLAGAEARTGSGCGPRSRARGRGSCPRAAGDSSSGGEVELSMDLRTGRAFLTRSMRV